MRKTIATEAGWVEETYPGRMVTFLSERVTERKGMLLEAACLRRIWHLLKTERGRKAVDVLDRCADGDATAEELAEAREDAWQSNIEIPNPQGNQIPETHALGAINFSASLGDMLLRVAEATAWEKVGPGGPGSEPEQRAQCVLVREIFGNPFRPVAVKPSWLTPDVLTLAEHIYRERAFDQMPILADALQDAGCDNEDVLSHCRQPGEHVRGCWVIDLLTGRK